MRFVLDASVALTWLLRNGSERDATEAFAWLARLKEAPAEAVMPAIGFLEVANVIARAEARGLVSVAHVEAFLMLLRALPLRLDAESSELALGPTLDLARRYALSAYDASYLEVALRRGLPLLSFDAELNRAAGRAGLPPTPTAV